MLTPCAHPLACDRVLSREEYLEEHYVNPEAGSYAIGGKMSKEEENDLLLQVVSAFSSADKVAGADAGVLRQQAAPTESEAAAQQQLAREVSAALAASGAGVPNTTCTTPWVTAAHGPVEQPHVHSVCRPVSDTCGDASRAAFAAYVKAHGHACVNTRNGENVNRAGAFLADVTLATRTRPISTPHAA